MPATEPVTNRSAAAVRSNTSAPSTASVSRLRSSACRGTCGSVIRAMRNETSGISGVSASVGTATTTAAPSKPRPKASPSQAATTPSSDATARPKNSGTSADATAATTAASAAAAKADSSAVAPRCARPSDRAGISRPARNA